MERRGTEFEENAWTSAKTTHKSYADAVKSPSLSGANLIPIGKHKPCQPKTPAHRRSAFERLEFSPRGTPQPGPRSVFDRQLSGQSQALRFNRPSDKIFHSDTYL